MLTIVEPGEDACVLCEKESEGVRTEHPDHGEQFCCYRCLKKLVRLFCRRPERPEAGRPFALGNGD